MKKELSQRFAPHECLHAIEVGWEALSNGDLLRKADQAFDVLVTVDKNMRFQSSLKGLTLRVAVLDLRSNLIEDLLAGVDTLLTELEQLPEGEFTVIRAR